ncbi:hybrid non-ribosomal peptide synthetase/type I polyketide synthase [Enhygromyxa salina]|uniref:Polyketide synthase PksN n=1 Tax=Enhygromyxa salina TaxID=215803 RepID=A0A2S9YN19_9BACT|nr:hybrid non-ribosomal peptide synthetase/type I polyketide synthase [Enhygromyxa salina]PRQ06480.1 Polyketide synthase PksN [Enhygromyxa salina]
MGSSIARELLRTLYDRGAGLTLVGDRLQIRAPSGAIDAELATQIQAEREQILALVHAHQGQTEALELPTLAPDPARRHEPFPLTDIQQAYWVGRGGEVELAVAIHVYVEIDGAIDLDTLSRAWLVLVERHEMLRAVALPDGRQRILPLAELPPWRIEVEDLSALAEPARAARLAALRSELAQQVLDISSWPPFEIRAAALGGGRSRLYFDIDCTFVDSWAVQLLFREWVAVYRAGASVSAAALTPARFELSFRDYVLATNNPDLPAFRRSAAYWDARLDTLPPAPALPLAQDPRALGRPQFRRWVDKLPRPEWDALAARGRDHGLTTPVLLIAAWAEVIALWAEAPEFTLNIPLFNRHPIHPEVVRVAGNFSSFTLLAVDARVGSSFAERAQRLREQLWRDLEHRFVSGVELLRQLFRRKGGISQAIMPVVFTSFASDVDGVEGSWVEYLGAELGEFVYSLTQTPQVWLDHQVIEQPDGGFFNWDAAAELFPAGMIDEMFRCYCSLLASLAASDEAWTRQTPSLAAQLHAQLQAVDQPGVEPSGLGPSPRLEARVFAQASEHPDAVAVVSGSVRLRYAELADRARSLAAALAARGASADQPVAIVLDKGWRQIVAVLGVLTAGAPWLPLDAELPPARLAELLLAARVELVVTRAGLRPAEDWPAGIVCVEIGEADEPATPDVEVAPILAAEAGPTLAAAIYTSGSTGAPKAALLSHEGLRNCIDATIQRFAIGPEDRCLALTALHHDMSIFDIFGPLSVGACVVVPEPEARRDPGRWAELILAESVTVWNSVPAMMEMQVAWLEARPNAPRPTSLRVAFMGGDWIPVELPDRLRAVFGASCQPVSVGGPTETTLWNIWFPIAEVDPSWTSIPYGTPLPNTRYWVMREAANSEDLVERPTWVAGELCCTGVGVGLGYLGDDDDSRARTAAKFVRHPITGEPMVRTGDRGRRLPDGTIEFLGRVDDQVSIGGYRIEPAEIEAALTRHPQVRTCAVVAAGSRHAKQLVAHVVPEPGATPVAAELRAQLLTRLPEHMVPHTFIVRAELPVTANGKIDRRQLAEQPVDAAASPRRDAQASGVADRPAIASVLATIIREIVGVEQVDPEANFFELGAHSVHLVRIHAELHRQLGLELPLVDLFKHPTVGFLADHVARHLETDDGEAARAHERQALEATLRARPDQADHAIAIVGMAGRFPGASNVDELWANVLAGRESVRRLSEDELRAAGVDEATFQRPDYVPVAAVLDDIDTFDAGFFGISEAEARLSDPQNRLLLEHAFEALEDAGWGGDRGSLRVGVYAGKSVSNYLFPALDLSEPIDYFKRLFGNDKDFIASSISYQLDLTGPSVAIHTACSTSLVAVALACQALCAGDCDMALAGGVSVKLPHHAGYRSVPGDGMFAPDGHCRPFDAEGRGIVPGSGSGVVALRRLDEALRDGDHIYAVIRGWATNNDGGHKVGFSAPDVAGQAAVIAAAHQLAGISADEISYVEAHGTGTPMGDPIEVEALRQAFRLGSTRRGYCTLGSIKANVGHLDAAAGVAGLIKTAQALAHETLPPAVNFTTANPHIDFAATPFVVGQAARPWPGPRRVAGLSSFGVGGTNAHLVLEQAPARPQPAPLSAGACARVVAVSAKTDAALATKLEQLAAVLGDDPGHALADVAWTCNLGRQQFERRVGFVGETREELRRALEQGKGLIRPRRATRPDRRVAWLFSGFGDQRVGMGRELHEHEPAFRLALDQCAAIAGETLELPNLIEALYPADSAPASATLDGDLVLAQVGLFCVEWSLACLWRSWGFEPDAVLGHSLGEYVAACVAGVFELPDALRLVAARAHLVETLAAPGQTRQVNGSLELVEQLLTPWRGQLQVASHNGPRSVVVSGHAEAMNGFELAARERELETKLISSTRAAHSPLMLPVLEALREVATTVRYAAPRLDVVSNLSGAVAGDEIASPDYWVRQLHSPVRLAECFATLHDDLGVETFVELGPAPALLWSGMQCVARRTGLWLPTLRPPRPERAQLLTAVASLYVDGASVDWARVHAEHGGRRISLPRYPFERRRFWIDEPTPAIWPARLGSAVQRRPHQPRDPGGHPLLGSRLRSPAIPDTVHVWESLLDQAWLADHRAEGQALLPGAAIIELAAAALAAAGAHDHELNDLRFERPVVVAAPTRVQVLVRRGEGELQVELHTLDPSADSYTRCAWASARPCPAAPRGFSLAAARLELGAPLDASDRYEALAARGYQFGPSFRGVAQLWPTPTGALAQIVAPAPIIASSQGYTWHPALLDACLQAVGIDVLERTDGRTSIPAHVESVRFGGAPGSSLWVRAIRREPTVPSLDASFDVDVIDEDGRALLEVRGLGLRAVERSQLRETLTSSAGASGAGDAEGIPALALEWIAKPRAQVSAVAPGRWLLIGADLADELAAQLTAAGHQGTVVADPNQALAWLDRADEARPSAVVYVAPTWAAPDQAATTGAQLLAAQAEICGPLLELVAGFERRGLTALASGLWVITAGARRVDASEPLAGIVQAPVWGLSAGVSLELPGLGCRSVDLDPRASTADAARSLAAELLAGDPEPQLALRGDDRLVPRLRPTSPPTSTGLALKGAWVLAGATGRVGRLLARWLASAGVTELSILSRREPDAILCEELVALGCAARWHRLDLRDDAGVDALAAELGAGVEGIVHAAGAIADRPVAQIDRAQLAIPIASKIAGSWNLARLADALDCPRLVLLSSSAAVVPEPGQANYAAANVFVDELARRRGPGVVALAFGPWGGEGLALADPQLLAKAHQRGLRPMSVDQGLAAFARAVQGEPQQSGAVMVADIDWAQRASWLGTNPLTRLLPSARSEVAEARAGERERPGAMLQRELARLPPTRRRARLATWVQAEAAAVLGLSDPSTLELHRGFVEFGLDSLAGLQLRNRIQELVGRELPVGLIYQHTNVAAMSEWLAELLGVADPEPAPAALDELGGAELAARLTDMLDHLDHLEHLEHHEHLEHLEHGQEREQR